MGSRKETATVQLLAAVSFYVCLRTMPIMPGSNCSGEVPTIGAHASARTSSRVKPKGAEGTPPDPAASENEGENNLLPLEGEKTTLGDARPFAACLIPRDRD